MSSSESLDLQARFVQQIALEVIHVDGYNRCLDDRSIVCLTATKFESFIFSMTCLALANCETVNITGCDITHLFQYLSLWSHLVIAMIIKRFPSNEITVEIVRFMHHERPVIVA